jgi:hypothetical protein
MKLLFYQAFSRKNGSLTEPFAMERVFVSLEGFAGGCIGRNISCHGGNNCKWL